MKNTKRFLSLILVLAMMLSSGITLYADGGGAGTTQVEEFEVKFNKSVDIPANYPIGLYYEDGDNKVTINDGDKLKAGTVIHYEDEERSRQTKAYLDGVLIDYRGVTMPNKAVTVDIIANGYTPNYILAERIAKRPAKWVTLTVNIGEGKLYKYRNRGEFETNVSVKIYVNPLYTVDILYGNGESAYLAGYTLNAPDGKIIKTRIYEKISADKVINVEYGKKPALTLTLHNSNKETKVINITDKSTYQDVLSQIRSAETAVQGKKLVCWSANEKDLKDFNDYNDSIDIYSTIIYPKEYDKYLARDYSSTVNSNYYYYQDKTNVDLYEITTDKENHVVRQFKLNEYTKLNGDIEKYFSIKGTYIVKKDGKSKYNYVDEDKDIRYKDIIWFGKDNEDNFYKILNFDKFTVEKLSKETKVTEDSNVAFKNAWKETESRERIDVYSSLEVEGDPKLDYTDEDNPKLDLSHMVLGIYEENKAPFYLPFENFGTEVTVEPANGTPLSYDQYNGKSIKVMYKNKIAYTGKLIINNDGFDKDNITNITIKTQPTTYYKIDKDPSETKLDLNKLVVTLTSPKKGSTSQEEVTRDVPYAKFDDYGLKVSMPNDETPAVYSDVDNNTILNITDNEKKLKVYINDNIFVETDKITVKDGVFRIENTKSIETKTEPTTKYVVGEMLDLDDLVLTFTDENDNTKDFTYEDLKKLGFNFALCGEDKKPPKTDEEIQKEFEEVINPMFEDVKSKEGVYEGSFDPQTRTVTVKILDKEKPFSELRGTGLVAGLVDLYNNNNLRKMQIGTQELRDLEVIKNNSADDSTFMQNIATIVALDMGNEVNGQGSNVNTLADFVDKEVVLHLTVLDPETNKEVTIDYTIKGEDGTPKTPEKTEDEIKEEFEEKTNPMFEDVKSKEGVYEGSFDPQTRTVTVKILDKDKPFSELRGTGLVAGLVDLYKNNHLTKMQIGSQDARDLVAIMNNSADDSAFMQNIATIVALDMGNEINGQGSSVNKLADFVGKEVVLKLTVLNTDTNKEIEIDYTIKGEDGTPEETPNPSEGTTGNDEETLPNSNEEALPNPAGGGNGQGETCIPIENFDKLELKDDGKKITIYGPQSGEKINDYIKGFKAEYEITVEDKVKVTYEFKSASEGKELPDKVKDLLPKEELVNPNSDYTATVLNTTEVKVEGGTWKFKGWDKESIDNIKDNTIIKGTWKFEEDKPIPPTPDPDPNPNPNPDPSEPDRPYWPGDDYYRPHRPYWPEDDYYRPYRPNNDGRRVAEEEKEEKPAEKTTMTEIKAIATIGSKELEILINGISSKKTMDVAAQINNGRTMLPLRFVAEALGFKVMWISETRTVVIYDDEFKVEIPVDSNLIIVNGVSYESDVKPQLVNNRTLLPIANIARALGLKDGTDILWNPQTRQATVIRRVYSK